jgi:ABC-type transport system involved in multi-copper enzyme maturation permease subunit
MNIIRLIAKDLRLQRNFVLPLMLLELAGYFAYLVQMPSHIPGVAFGLLHGVALIGDFLICYRTMIAEEKNRALMFIKTLPVSTAEIVIAKFAVNLLLVGLNIGVLLALWGGVHGLGWIQLRPNLTIHLVVAGLTFHCLNNAFFVTLSLVFSSERAVWVPFPAIFVLMSVILNFRRIKVALNLQALVDLLQRHDLLSLVLLWAIIVGFAATCSWVLRHKRVFA